MTAPLSTHDAAAMLGISVDADAAEVRRAFRRTVAASHPDRGGNMVDASALVAARDLLLHSAVRPPRRPRGFVKRRRFVWR